MRHIVKKKKREKRHDCIWISNVLDFEIDVCVYSFMSSIHVCMHSYIISCDETLRGRFLLPPRLLSPRQSAVVCKQTQRGKLCMRTGFRQSYLFYVNTFSIRNQLCVFVTLCAHTPASPRRSYLLECVQMWCCWWSAAFAEQHQQQCWSVCRAGGGFGSNLQCNQNIGRGQGRSRSVQSENPLTHWSGAL